MKPVNSRIFRRPLGIHCLMVMAFLGTMVYISKASPVDPTPLPTFIYIPIYFYDEEQHAGLVDSFYSGAPDGSHTEVYVDSAGFYYNQPYPFATIKDSRLLDYIGDSVRFQMSIPGVGIYEGLSRVGEGSTWYVIPSTSEALQHTLWMWTQTLSLEECWVDMNPYVVNGYSQIGYAQSLNSLDHLANPLSVLIERSSQEVCKRVQAAAA